MVHLRDAPGGAAIYLCCGAGAHPTGDERGARMYLAGFDNRLARERVQRIRQDVAQNRLEARLARVARSDGDDGVARGAALVAALFR